VRVVRYPIAQPGFRTQMVTLITTLLDVEIKAADLAALYFRRWGIELHFREIKVLLNMDVLRCLSPAMIERELRMHFVAYLAPFGSHLNKQQRLDAWCRFGIE